MPKTILIIEDTQTELLLIQKALNPLGHRLLHAADGEAGYDAVLRDKPDLIILDVVLPKLDGFQVCRKLRKEGITTPVIMCSSKTQESDKFWGLKQGANEYLNKPIDEATFRATAAKHL